MSQATLFMQVDGVKGVVSDKNYKNWIAIGHMTQGIYSAVRMDNATGQLNHDGISFDQVSFSKEMDATSTVMSNMVAEGKGIKQIIVAMAVKTEGKTHEMARWTYNDCIMSAYALAADTVDVPRENISFVFNTIKFETNMVEPDGKTSKQGPVGWNLSENTKL